MLAIYLIIGLLYWSLNSFVRKLETDGDYLLPLVWFLAWPLAFITWLIILSQWIIDYLTRKFAKNQL